MADRKGVRSLARLQNSASTARVLNLLSVWSRHKEKPEYAQAPFFQNVRLNRSIIIKHRLRPDEMDLFEHPRVTGTKIIFPIDTNDLKLGGQSVFIQQKNFGYLLEDVLGRQPDAVDVRLLEVLDELPSLDPFLMREGLKHNGYRPAACYLELSEADLKRIFNFVQGEIEPLVKMSIGGASGYATQTSKLVAKILASTLDSEMEPLRAVLRLSESEFAEGIFCWKGFLYYKWVYDQTVEESREVITQILKIIPRGTMDSKSREIIEHERSILANAIVIAADGIKDTLTIYDNAYSELTQKANPLAFRNFLLNSPTLFAQLGEKLGTLQHITSFWRFRFPGTRNLVVSVDELVDIFMDFQSNLQTQVPHSGRHDSVSHRLGRTG